MLGNTTQGLDVHIQRGDRGNEAAREKERRKKNGKMHAKDDGRDAYTFL